MVVVGGGKWWSVVGGRWCVVLGGGGGGRPLKATGGRRGQFQGTELAQCRESSRLPALVFGGKRVCWSGLEM